MNSGDMHEMSLCEGILQILEDQAQPQGYASVKTVWLEVGALAGVEMEALKFAFDVVTKGTLADGAKLEVIEVEGQAWCLPCEKTISINARFDACPECGSHQLQICGGEELQVKELEVE